MTGTDPIPPMLGPSDDIRQGARMEHCRWHRLLYAEIVPATTVRNADGSLGSMWATGLPVCDTCLARIFTDRAIADDLIPRTLNHAG